MKTETVDTIISNWNYQNDFPELPEDLIQRPHLLATIKDILSSATPVVFLEGEEGDGATTTLAQFCKANEESSFSLFIKPASRFAYSPEYLKRVLAEQFHWFLFKAPFPKDYLTVSDFETLIQKVRGRARSEPVYFLVDGLHQIPREDRRIITQITQEVLPLGVTNFRFIISGQQEDFPTITKKIKSKPYQQLRFRPEETQAYFSALNMDGDDVLDVHNLCKGIPGRLASVRRLILIGNSIEMIRNAEPGKLPEFVKMEFESIGRFTDPQKEFIAAITFAKRYLTIEEATEVAQLSNEVALEVLRSCPFLNLSSQSGRIEFVSESHRKFAEKQLESLKKGALKRQVDYLIAKPKSEAALRFLPAYYEALNKENEIIQLLSPEHYADLFNQTQSVSALRNRAELGRKSASSLRLTADIFKFALQKSIFSAVGSIDVSEAEIEAAVSLGKTHTALVLANQANSKEDRLALLSRYARRLKEKVGSVDPELVSYINELAKGIDIGAMGSSAIDVAADVVLFDPDLAISMVESVQANEQGNTRDAAYMHLSLSASFSKLRHKTEIEDKARNKIADESMRKLAVSFDLLASNLDAAEAIRIIEGMEPSNRLYFLKSIIKTKRNKAHALDLVDYGLELIVRETSYTPKSGDLADLAAPMPKPYSDHDRLKNLVQRFDAQMGLLAKTAFSKDMVRLQLRLAGAELQFDPEASRRRLLDCYYEIASIKTSEIQIECFAIFLGIIKVIDVNEALEKTDGFKAIIRGEIAKLLDNILENTGSHVAALTGVLDILIDDDPGAALQLAKRLNTQNRRMAVFSAIAKSIAGGAFSDSSNAVLKDCLMSIEEQVLRANVANAVVSEIAAGKHAEKWFASIDFSHEILLKPQYICAYETARMKSLKAPPAEEQLNAFVNRFHSIAQNFNSSIELIAAYFHASEALAKNDVERAEDLYKAGVALKNGSESASDGALEIITTCISLVCRSFSPLMRKNDLQDDFLNRLMYLVDSLPCLIARSIIYAELSERAWVCGSVDLCRKIAFEKCNPILEEVGLKSKYCKNIVLHAIFPALSGAHLESSYVALTELDSLGADSALYNACMLRLRKLPTADPYYDNDSVDYSKVEREDILDAISLTSRMREDATIYASLVHLVDAVCDKTNKLKFTVQQKSDFFQRCEQIIAKGLPDAKNILHDGFKIAALAQIYRLQDVSFAKWENLELMADSVKNHSDHGYVLLAIANSMPGKFESHRQRHLTNSLAFFEKIPSSLDRLIRLRSYVKETWKTSPIAAKDTLRKAMLISIDLGADDRASSDRREIIELADQINPDLAKELIELIDDDPARQNMKAELKKTATASKTKRDLANGREIAQLGKASSEDISEAAWKNTAGLLAGRLETKPLAIMGEYLARASGNSLQEAFGMFSWYLENTARKYISETDILAQVKPLSEALLLSTEIASSIISRAKRRAYGSEDEEGGGSLLMARGDRAGALDFISQWLKGSPSEHIKVSDPYFGPEDVSLLRIVLAECPAAKITVLTSKKTLQERGHLSDVPFLEQWRAQVDQDPPNTDIVAMAYEMGNKAVIHDRWIISGASGLRLGTSFNSLGQGKISEISEMEPVQAIECGNLLDKFISRPKVVEGARISYVVFSL